MLVVRAIRCWHEATTTDFLYFITHNYSKKYSQKKLKHDFETHIHSKRLHDSVENLTQKEQAG